MASHFEDVAKKRPRPGDESEAVVVRDGQPVYVDTCELFVLVGAIMTGQHGYPATGTDEGAGQVVGPDGTAAVRRFEMLMEDDDVHPTKKTVSGHKKTP